MEQRTIRIGEREYPFYAVQTIVVGSGAAGLNSAVSLYKAGQRDIAILTEGRLMGTSRNTGSDKQTYYKLTTCGSEPDSIRKMAQTLFDGQAMDGDLALAEAALSLRGFYHLVDIGVPFPCNGSGEYVGYKTDHDPNQRGTSAGPLTSKFMTEALWEEAERYQIPVFDGYQVIELLTDDEEVFKAGQDRQEAFQDSQDRQEASQDSQDRIEASRDSQRQEEALEGSQGRKRVRGLVALNVRESSVEKQYTVFAADNIVYGTGGEAGMYDTSVYPVSQTGGMGCAFRAGARGKNLTESQYGIASIKFRWNLSGTYQQVIPRYISTAADGSDEREFLDEYFSKPEDMLYAIFLKGYQWPFDPRKTVDYGSSLIDLLVYQETVMKGRRVYLDYRRNPSAAEDKGHFLSQLLHQEAYDYLKSSDGLWDTPIDRLEHMNPAAIELYRSHNIDLYTEQLEIAVCAQHNNGGLAGNSWWESNLAHFFPVGEVNGTHGVYRPGGSALNSGQVGSLRAAQFIAGRYVEEPWDADTLARGCGAQVERAEAFGMRAAEKGRELLADGPEKAGGEQLTGKLEIPGGLPEGKLEEKTSGLPEGKLEEKTSGLPEGKLEEKTSGLLDWKAEKKTLGVRMSKSGANIRSLEGVEQALAENLAQQERVNGLGIQETAELKHLYRLRDLLVSQQMYLEAIRDYIRRGGTSRGSYLICDPEGKKPLECLPEEFRFSLEDKGMSGQIQEIVYEDGRCQCFWRPVRPIPEEDGWFEMVWRNWREGVYFNSDRRTV